MKIAIIGQGNVAWHLNRWFSGKAEVVPVNSRGMDTLPSDADIYIISVSDNAICEVARKLIGMPGIVAHTSGTTSIEVVPKEIAHRGVFYPMQTFTKGKALVYDEIPLFVEGSEKGVEDALYEFAASVSQSVERADSSRRRKLHLAAVLACNYVNYLFTLADDLLRGEHLDLSVLYPLIEETVGKCRELTPVKSQTGPARRRDTLTLQCHLEVLPEGSDLQTLYALMAKMIMQRYQN
jgi:predicted short-subunit dehydrogenase-like oxidoreductase (DUF2520 family)